MIKRSILGLLSGGLLTLMLTMNVYAGISPAATSLTVTMIPEDDQLREKGVMLLCVDIPGVCDNISNLCRVGTVGNSCSQNSDCDVSCDALGTSPTADTSEDLHAAYKIHVVDNLGQNRCPSTLECKVVEKEVCHVGNKAQGGLSSIEVEATETIDVSRFFDCTFLCGEGSCNFSNNTCLDGPNQGEPCSSDADCSVKPGVGVLNVNFSELPGTDFIGDHMLKVIACVEPEGICGSEIQDLCILNWPTCRAFRSVGMGRPDACRNDKDPNFINFATGVPADPIWPFASCKTAAFWQRNVASGLPVKQCLFSGGKLVGVPPDS
jgi:hypothetical protein